ncbi:DUF11 domain-containing protein [Methanobrevibacter filiformis]|uniref:DUF11 domain-containing protein n=1 Tax=Methanobrevibacter filiformis TaxID=55758 RepID=A0A166CCW6_9EURY|nr:DUF11 domain-containing protein [Methanobrevibacter filiformis]KZX14378.1 hypothetical protein MBFIL_08950 [Methanobrevibacter filiformis]
MEIEKNENSNMKLDNRSIKKRINITRIAIILSTIAILFVSISSISAVNINLTTTGSINSAVSTINSGGDVNNSITLDAGTYNKASDRNNNLTFSNKNLTIQGNGTSSAVIVNGSNLGRLFNLSGSNVNFTLKNITFTNAKVTGNGSVIYTSQPNVYITLINCVFKNNLATNTDSGAAGGVIYTSNTSNFIIDNSSFINNTVNVTGNVNTTFRAYGGVISASQQNGINSFTINNSLFANNIVSISTVYSSYANGGVIYSSSSSNVFIIANSNFTNNTAKSSSNNTNSTFDSYTAGSGGVIYTQNRANLTIIESIFSNNTINSSNINSRSSASSSGGVISLGSSGNFNISRSIFSNNIVTVISNSTTSQASGGAISAMATYNVTDSNFTNNSVITVSNSSSASSEGGAIRSPFSGTINIINSTFANNTAIASSSTTYAYSRGGSINNWASDNNVSLINSLFVNNMAKSTSASTSINAYSKGGAVCINDGVSYSANLTVDNSTFANNTAISGTNSNSYYAYSMGGAIYKNDIANLNINNSTFLNNGALSNSTNSSFPCYGGAIYLQSNNFSIIGSEFINNTVLSNGSGSDYTQGGAIFLQNNTGLIIGSNFVNSSASYGGAMAINNNTNLTLEYSRIYNNTNTNDLENGQIYIYNSIVNGSYNWWGNNTDPLINSIKVDLTGTLYLTNYFIVNITLFDIDRTNDLLVFNYTIVLNTSEIAINDLSEFNGTIDRNGFVEFIFSANLSTNLSVPFNQYINTTATAKIDNFTKTFSINASEITDGYVNATGGSDTNNGLNWTNAVKSIEKALEIVGDNGIIHIAGNNYNNTNGIERNNTNLTINKNITILGYTALSGEVIIDALNNGRIFLINKGLNVTLINLTFANANLTGNNNNGGAIYNNGSKIAIFGSNFINNTAYDGGAIYNNNGTSFIINENTRFINNTAYAGGAIYTNGANFSVNNSTFTNSNAYNGGAIYNFIGLNFSVSGSIFTSNNANGGGGAIYNGGRNFSVSGSIFTSNNANGGGGAIYNTVLNGVGVNAGGNNFSVNNSTFTNNNASTSGGAIYNFVGVNFSVSGSIFTSNNASSGGVIYNYGANFSVNNSTFTNNNASTSGGAIYNILGINFTVNGSIFSNNAHIAIYTSNNRTFINNNSFDGNDGVLGMGFSDSTIDLDSYLLSNNTIINNDIVLIVDGSRNNISNSIMNNNTRGIFVNGQNNTFSNITIANLKFGLAFNSSSRNNVFTNGTLEINEVGAIINGTNNTIISSTIVNNTLTGVNITGDNNTINYNRIYQNTLGMINSGNKTNANFNWWGKNNITDQYTNTGTSLNLTHWYVLQLSLNSTFNTTANATRNYTKNIPATLSYTLTLNNLTTNTPSLLPHFTVEVLLRNSTSVINNSAGDIRTLTFSQVVILTNNNLQSSINALADDENIVLILDNETKVNLTILKVANVTNILNNDTIEFTITIINNGYDFASGVTFTDSLPDNFKLLNVTGGSSYNNTTGIWTVGDIGPGVTVTLKMMAQAIKSGTINNTANNVTAIETLINPDIKSTVTITVTPTVNLNITKVSNVTGLNNSHIGDHVKYVITIKNNGLDNASNVRVYDILDSKLTYITYNSSTGTYNNTTGLWNIGILHVNQTATLEIEVIISNIGTIENIANVTANEIILNGSNTNTSTTIHVGPLNSTLIINPVVSAKVNSSVSINGTLLDENGVPISGVIVNLVVNDVVYNATTDARGNWNISYFVGLTGVIDVVAEFVGNVNYTGAANATYFDGLPLNSTLVINPIVDTKVNSSVSINGSLLDEKGAPVSGVTINLTIDNVDYNATTDASGKWSIIYHVGSTGRINVVAEFVGNANHTGAANSTYFNGLTLNSTLVINPIVSAKVNSSVSINGTLLDENAVPISGVIVNLIVNGVVYNVTTDASGNWNITYLVISTGVIDVVAEFVGNVNYAGAVNATYFDGLALNSTLVINPVVDTKVNSSVSINGTLLDENGVPISGVIVNLVVNGVVYNATTDASGNWNITYLVISNGVVNVVAEFVGNTNYVAAVNTTYFNGAALNSTLIINPIMDTKMNSNVSINGSLFGENNSVIGNVTVVVTVNGVSYNVTTDVGGKWGITYLVNSTGLFNVVAIFNGNTNHAAAGNETSFNGISLNSTLVINPIPDTNVNSNVSINGSLFGENNSVIGNVTVVVTVNGVNYNGTTDNSGKWNISYFVKSSGNINVVAEFNGNNNYFAAVNSTNFNGISSNNSTLIINPVPDTKINSNVSINGTLLDENNNAIINVTVVVAVNGVSYNATTDARGNWNINYLVNSTGNINVVAEFVGNANYVAAVNSTNFNGLALNSTLVINPVTNAKMNSNVSINGSLFGENNSVIGNVTVVVTVNGVSYNATTDARGNWNINYLVNSTGNINVVAVFDGNDKYVSAVNSTTFIVNNNVNISIVKIASINGINNSAKGHVGDTVIYTINVVNNGVIGATGVLVTEIIDSTKLKFNKASVTQGFYNNINGLWIIDGFAAGKTVTLTINATIIAMGDIGNSANVSASENNTNSNNSSSVNIVSVAIPTQINTLDVVVVVDNFVKLESILKDSDGKPIGGKEVRFYVNGKFVGTAVTDVKGIAYFKYTPTKTGTLNYTSSFTDPTGIYLPSTSTSTVTVTKDQITLTTTLPTGSVGDKKTIKVKATNSEGKPVPNKTFTVYINGKKIGTYKTNSKGEFTIKTTLKSSNKLQIKFVGDSKYNKLSKTYTYIAKSKEKTITTIYYAKTKYGNSIILKTKLTNGKGKALAGKYIKFYVAGKYVGKAKTNKKGIAIFKYTPKKKK